MSLGALAQLKRRPQSAGLFLDFDGTLSHIVSEPGEARPAEGVVSLLGRLGEVMKLVAIVSGRSAHQLLEWLGPDVEIWGLHGAERTRAGEVILSERAEGYQAIMRRAAEDARVALPKDGIEVEDKGVMVGLHYRRAPEEEPARRLVEKTARELAERYDLSIGEGRMVVELRPPLGFSKAAVILERARAAQLESVAFMGDDIVDLPAFGALDVLESEGMKTVRVGVASDEAPAELIDRTDIVVQGPTGVVALLTNLLD